VGSIRQTTSENAERRHLSGRTGPVMGLLDGARECWASEGNASALRRELLEVLLWLEADEA
jgi:hypothetical protein